MGDYTFRKQSNGQHHRYRNGELQDIALNSEIQLLQRIEELEQRLIGQTVRIEELKQRLIDKTVRLENMTTGYANAAEMLGKESQSTAHIEREAIETMENTLKPSPVAAENYWYDTGYWQAKQDIKKYAEQLTKESE